jgi:hypothetical protein
LRDIGQLAREGLGLLKREGGGETYSSMAVSVCTVERQPAVRLPVGASPVQGCRPARKSDGEVKVRRGYVWSRFAWLIYD